ncbi:MAG TPA: type II toxin-antitoxin system VapC family toxin [Oscillatoriaceae cyanobacterium]
MKPVVLDTHVWLWVMNGAPIAQAAEEAIAQAAAQGNVFVPAISVWEVGMLEAKGRLQLSAPVLQWAERALQAPGIRLAELTPAIAIASSQLPGVLHGEPADRLIAATARHHSALLITRDQKLIDYGQTGFLQVVPA